MSRQTRLAEVGEKGQAKLASATAVVHETGLAGIVEERYLVGAGIERVVHEQEEAELPFEVAHPAAQEVALGAHAALVSIREILEI